MSIANQCWVCIPQCFNREEPQGLLHGVCLVSLANVFVLNITYRLSGSVETTELQKLT